MYCLRVASEVTKKIVTIGLLIFKNRPTAYGYRRSKFWIDNIVILSGFSRREFSLRWLIFLLFFSGGSMPKYYITFSMTMRGGFTGYGWDTGNNYQQNTLPPVEMNSCFYPFFMTEILHK